MIEKYPEAFVALFALAVAILLAMLVLP